MMFDFLRNKSPRYLDNRLVQYSVEQIEQWSQFQIILEEEKQKHSGNIVNDKDVTHAIGSAIHCVHCFSVSVETLLASHLNSGLFSDSALRVRIKRMIDYVKFRCNILIANVKHFFFRETPNKPLNFQTFAPEMEAYVAGRKIIRLISKLKPSKREVDRLEKELIRFYYFITFLYCFIFDQDHHSGCFLKFDYSTGVASDIFSMIIDMLHPQLVASPPKEGGVRQKIHEVIPAVLDYYQRVDTTSQPVADRYSTFVGWYSSQVNSKVAIEPFSWWTIMAIYYVDGQLQEARDYHIGKSHIESRERKETYKSIDKFICEMKRVSSKYYRDALVPWDDMYSCESMLIASLSSADCDSGALTVTSYCENVYNTKKHINEYLGEARKYYENKKLISHINIDSLKALKAQKVESLLEEEDASLVSFIIYSFSMFVKNKLEDLGLTDNKLVGFSSSGMFLVHLFNAMTESKYSVWFFRFFPYVSIHPAHWHDYYDENVHGIISKRLVLFDETIRTGFTLSSFLASIQRNNGLHQTDSMFAIFSDSRYHTISKEVVKSYSFVDVSSEEYKRTASLKNFIGEELFEVNPLRGIADQEAINIAREVAGFYNCGGRFDTNFIITNTKFMIGRCYNFAVEINKLAAINSKKQILLFSSNSEGNIARILTAFFLKVRYGRQVVLTNKKYNSYNPAELIHINIDVCSLSGFTFAYNWSIFSSVPPVISMGDPFSKEHFVKYLAKTGVSFYHYYLMPSMS